ncbi:MAG: metal-dependent transcriptional regulator [Candidatus Eisenbacteria bacterium]
MKDTAAKGEAPRPAAAAIGEGISAALEDYLEIILELSSHTRAVRVRDIANAKAVRMPTVTWALRTLAARKLVAYRAREYVELTSAGAAIAHRVTGRHLLLERFLAEILQVPPETSAQDACRLEHHLSGVTIERLSAFVEYVQTCPGVGAAFLERFHQHFGRRPASAACPLARPHEDGGREIDTAGDANLAPLARVPEGCCAEIGRLLAGRAMRSEFLKQGLVPGAVVEVVRSGKARQATVIRLQGRELALPAKQAARVLVLVKEGPATVKRSEGKPHDETT